MRLTAIGRRAAQVFALCGLLMAFAIVGGCGRHPAAAPALSKTEAPKTNAVAAAPTNSAEAYTSVFEDLPPSKGKDPFFPLSHRRDPKVEAPSEPNVTAPPVDADLLLQAIIRTSTLSQAVINGEVFEAGKEQSVRVPNGRVRVRCIEIGSNYVLIQAEGEAEPKKLKMRADGEKKD